MSMVEQNGIYLATPEGSAIEEKDTGTVFFVGVFVCTAIKDKGQWLPIDGDQRITAYLNLIDKKGSANEINVRALRESMGWSGASFADLQRDEWPGVEVQLVVGEEEYQGKKQRKVMYLNPKDYAGPSVSKSDTSTIQSLDAKYGAMLRALGGTKQDRNGKSGVAAPASGGVGKDLAWQALVAKCDGYSREHPDDAYDQNRKIAKFKEIVAAVIGGKSGSQITPSDWATIKTTIEKDFIPALGDLCPI